MAKSSIEWTDFTWNTITGCTRVSQGCVNCYAETQSPLLKARYEGTARKAAKKWASDPRTKLLPAHVQASVFALSGGEKIVVEAESVGANTRVRTIGGLRNVYPKYPITLDPFQRPYGSAFNVTMRPELLQEPFSYSTPSRVFTNSMSDPFHVDVPFAFVNMKMGVIADCPQHHFQMLTKRADRMAEYFKCRKVPRNLWVGVSVENKDHGVPRIKHLQSINAEVRWLSIEPLLEDLGTIDLDGIHWVVVGGESGSKKVRPMHIDWVRRIRDQCVDRGIAFFFKQWGSHDADGSYQHKRDTGRQLDGKEWNQFPEELAFE